MGLCLDSSREIKESKSSNRAFSHVEIILYVKEGTFCGVVFSVSRLKAGHKTIFIKVSLKLQSYNSFKNL